MKQYLELIERVLKEGYLSDDRTGIGTLKIFGHQSTYSMDDGFPLLTLKKTWIPGVVHELLWFLGCHMKDEKYKKLPMTNIEYLVDNKVNIWNEWVDEDGNLGHVYGKQWVDYGGKFKEIQKTIGGSFGGQTHVLNRKNVYQKGINQIQNVINKLTEGHNDFNPIDRGLIVSAWNVEQLEEMALRPCHTMFQFQARELNENERRTLFFEKHEVSTMEVKTSESFDNSGIPKYELSLQLYQRSLDILLGCPFNIASYSLLLHMFCHVVNMKPGKFVHSIGDAHIYLNHKEQVNKLLTRTFEYSPTEDIDIENWKDVKVLTNNKGEEIDFWNLDNKNWRLGPYIGPELPKLWLNPKIKNIFDFTYDDIKIKNYNPLPTIKAEVSV